MAAFECILPLDDRANAKLRPDDGKARRGYFQLHHRLYVQTSTSLPPLPSLPLPFPYQTCAYPSYCPTVSTLRAHLRTTPYCNLFPRTLPYPLPSLVTGLNAPSPSFLTTIPHSQLVFLAHSLPFFPSHLSLPLHANSLPNVVYNHLMYIYTNTS